jgi:hypothetical protein
MLAPDHVVEGLLHHAYLFAEYLQHVWTDHKILPKQILLAAQQPAEGRVWFMAQLIDRTAAASLGSNWAQRRCSAFKIPSCSPLLVNPLFRIQL